MAKKPEIIYQDSSIVLVNKPAGVLSIPDRFVPEKPNLVHMLEGQFEKVWVVHRLDKDTSGLICFGLNEAAHKSLSLQFQEREVKKIYSALLSGNLRPEEGAIDRPITPHPTTAGKMLASAKGKSALTLYKVDRQYRNYCLVSAEIKTGRTHQIRVHFSSLGHPLAVDELYGGGVSMLLSQIKGKKYRLGKNQVERPLMSRLSLHATYLSLTHPAHGEVMEFTAPLPKDFSALLKQLEKWG